MTATERRLDPTDQLSAEEALAQDVALLNAVLLAAGLDDCIAHGNIPSVVILLGFHRAFVASGNGEV